MAHWSLFVKKVSNILQGSVATRLMCAEICTVAKIKKISDFLKTSQHLASNDTFLIHSGQFLSTVLKDVPFLFQLVQCHSCYLHCYYRIFM